MKTFIDSVLEGEAKLDDIDDWVDRWHKNHVTAFPLHHFLGMTWEEYGEWVQTPSKLAEIVEKHRVEVKP